MVSIEDVVRAEDVSERNRRALSALNGETYYNALLHVGTGKNSHGQRTYHIRMVDGYGSCQYAAPLENIRTRVDQPIVDDQPLGHQIRIYKEASLRSNNLKNSYMDTYSAKLSIQNATGYSLRLDYEQICRLCIHGVWAFLRDSK